MTSKETIGFTSTSQSTPGKCTLSKHRLINSIVPSGKEFPISIHEPLSLFAFQRSRDCAQILQYASLSASYSLESNGAPLYWYSLDKRYNIKKRDWSSNSVCREKESSRWRLLRSLRNPRNIQKCEEIFSRCRQSRLTPGWSTMRMFGLNVLR